MSNIQKMRQEDELYIENSPPRHPWFIIGILLPYIIFWILALVLWATSALLIYKKEFPLFLPLIIGIAIFLTIFQTKLTKALIWLSFGKETIRIVDGQLFINRKRAIGFKKLKLDLNLLNNIRLAPNLSTKNLSNQYFNIFLAKGLYAPKLGGRVLLDYKETTIPIGNLLPENEAIALIEAIEPFLTLESSDLKKAPKKFEKLNISKTDTTTKIKFTRNIRSSFIIGISGWWVAWTSITLFVVEKFSIQSLTDLQNLEQKELLGVSLLILGSILVFSIILSFILAHETIIINNKEIKIYRRFPYLIPKTIRLTNIDYLTSIEELNITPLLRMGSKYGGSSLLIIRKGYSLVLEYENKEFKFGRDLDNPEALQVYSILDEKIIKAHNKV